MMLPARLTLAQRAIVGSYEDATAQIRRWGLYKGAVLGPKARPLTRHQLGRLCCLHEAGHGVTFAAGGARIVRMVFTPESTDSFAATTAELDGMPVRDYLRGVLGGAAAEALARGVIDPAGCSTDFQMAADMAERCGLADYDALVVLREAMAILRPRWRAVLSLAGALHEYGTLDTDDVQRCLPNRQERRRLMRSGAP